MAATLMASIGRRGGQPTIDQLQNLVPVWAVDPKHTGSNGSGWNDEGVSYTLDTSLPSCVGMQSDGGVALRRLTPLECERLQGFPDGWTDVPHEGGPMANTHRYRLIGNAWAVNVARWVGERIQAFEEAVG